MCPKYTIPKSNGPFVPRSDIFSIMVKMLQTVAIATTYEYFLTRHKKKIIAKFWGFGHQSEKRLKKRLIVGHVQVNILNFSMEP